jgi:hypothetical protein
LPARASSATSASPSRTSAIRARLLVFDDAVTGASIDLYVHVGNALLGIRSPRSAEATDHLIDEAAVLSIGSRWAEHLSTLE